MKASEELAAARDELYAAIEPAVRAYEERTGLRVDEIAVERSFGVQMIGEKEMSIRPMQGIKVRTNACSL